MATFSQWAERYPERKRLVYVCGEDKALCDFVYRAELQSRQISDLDFAVMSGRDKMVDIMVTLDQFAKGDNERVVVIRESDKLKKWEPITVWCSNVYMRNTTLICVGEEVKPDTNQAYLRPFIEKGRFIECKPLDEAQLKQFVISRGGLTNDGAQALIELTSGNTFRILNEMRKLSYFGTAVNAEVVRKYVEPQIQELFTDSLFAGDKTQALRHAQKLELSDYALVIGTIEYNLCNMILLINQSRSLSAQEIATRTGIPIFLLYKYWTWLRGVNLPLLYKRVKVLANLDMLYRDGNAIAALERLVLLW